MERIVWSFRLTGRKNKLKKLRTEILIMKAGRSRIKSMSLL